MFFEAIEKVKNLNHLKQRIAAAINSVTLDILRRTWAEGDYLLDVFSRSQLVQIKKILRYKYKLFQIVFKTTLTNLVYHQ